MPFQKRGRSSTQSDQNIDNGERWPYGAKFMVYNLKYMAWYRANVVKITNLEVQVRYAGWGEEYDEKIEIFSDRFDFEAGGRKHTKWGRILGAAGAFKRLNPKDVPTGAMLESLPPPLVTAKVKKPAAKRAKKPREIEASGLPVNSRIGDDAPPQVMPTISIDLKVGDQQSAPVAREVIGNIRTFGACWMPPAPAAAAGARPFAAPPLHCSALQLPAPRLHSDFSCVVPYGCPSQAEEGRPVGSSGWLPSSHTVAGLGETDCVVVPCPVDAAFKERVLSTEMGSRVLTKGGAPSDDASQVAAEAPVAEGTHCGRSVADSGQGPRRWHSSEGSERGRAVSGSTGAVQGRVVQRKPARPVQLKAHPSASRETCPTPEWELLLRQPRWPQGASVQPTSIQDLPWGRSSSQSNAHHGRAGNAPRSQAENVQQGRAGNTSLGRAGEASQGRAGNTYQGQTGNAFQGRARNSCQGRTADALKGRSGNASQVWTGGSNLGLMPQLPPATRPSMEERAPRSDLPPRHAQGRGIPMWSLQHATRSPAAADVPVELLLESNLGAMVEQQGAVLLDVLQVARRQQQDMERIWDMLEDLVAQLKPSAGQPPAPAAMRRAAAPAQQQPNEASPTDLNALPTHALPGVRAALQECCSLDCSRVQTRLSIDASLEALRQVAQKAQLQELVNEAEYCVLVPRGQDGQGKAWRLDSRSFVELPAGTLVVVPSSSQQYEDGVQEQDMLGMLPGASGGAASTMPVFSQQGQQMQPPMSMTVPYNGDENTAATEAYPAAAGTEQHRSMHHADLNMAMVWPCPAAEQYIQVADYQGQLAVHRQHGGVLEGGGYLQPGMARVMMMPGSEDGVAGMTLGQDADSSRQQVYWEVLPQPQYVQLEWAHALHGVGS